MNITTNDENLSLDLTLSAQEAVLDVDLFEDDMILDVSLYPDLVVTPMNVMVQTPHVDVKLEIGTVLCNGGGYPEYEGPYIAVPKTTEQVFETYHREMQGNFIVREITYIEEPNSAGGITAIIGEA